MNKYTAIFFGISLSTVWYSCQQPTAEQSIEKKQFCISKELKPLIKLDALQEQEIKETLTLSGNINYNEDDIVSFKSMLDAVVTTVNFDLGQYVQQGQVLATLKSTSLNDLAQERVSIQNQISLTKQRLKTMQSMFEDGLASAREVEELQVELATQNASLNSLSSNLSLYNATSEKGVFQIKAPKSGYIVEKNINPGINISALDEELFKISNIKQIWVMVNIYATNMQDVQNGAEVKVRTLAYPNEVFSGKIDRISNVFDHEERVLKARIVLENPDLKLKPGMSADIIIEKNTNTQQRAIAIPTKDIIFHNNQQYVVLYKSDCEIEIRKVVADAQNDNYVYVKKGFAAGEQLITQNELLVFEELNK